LTNRKKFNVKNISMSKHLRWVLYKKRGKILKHNQENWTRYLVNYYKKPHKNLSDIQERWEIIRAKQVADREEEEKIKRIKKAHKELIKDIRHMDNYGDKNISSSITRSKQDGLLNKNLELKIQQNKWLNYFNSKRIKSEIRRKDIKPFKKLMVQFKYVFNNIIESHKEDLESRKISNKLLIPNYYFPSKYIERSLPSQAKHWLSNVYSFLRRDGASMILLDRFTTELIKRFFSVKRIKRRLFSHKWKIYTYRLLKTGYKYKASKQIYKQLNRIIEFSRRGAYKGDPNVTTYFHPGILKSKWLKRQISKSFKIKKKLLRRRIDLFGGYEPKKTSRISKWRRLWLGKPIFKHTPFNVVIDLFIFNNKTNQLKKFRNVMMRRFAYKYIYSLYVDVYKKVNETINRPRFFYINIIEPKVFPYYTKVVKSYEEWVFKYNKGLVITICLMLLKINEVYKKTIKSVKKTRKLSISRLNKIFKYNNYNLNNMYINILNKLGIDNLFNIDKDKVDVISLYKKEEDSLIKKDKKPYKSRDLTISKPNAQPLSNKQMRKKLNRMKYKARKKERKKKGDERIKKFGEKKLTFTQYKKKQIYDRRRGKKMDQKEFKEKLKGFHLYSHHQKQNDSSNEKKYIWYSPKEWERRKKEEMNENKYKDSKLDQKNKSKKNNKNIKENKPINKLLTKFGEVKIDKIRPLCKSVENIPMEKKNIILEISKDKEKVIGEKNINQLDIIKNNYKRLSYYSFFTNYYKSYWDYTKAHSNKININGTKFSKNKRRKLRIEQEKENKEYNYRNIGKIVYYINKIKLLKKKFVLNNIKSNIIKDRKKKSKLTKKKKIGNLKSASLYINKRNWLRKQWILRKNYALYCIKNMIVPVKQKKKRFQKKAKKNEINIIELNKKVKTKNTKKIWDKLDYSLLSILSKYLSVKGNDKFQSNYMSLDSIYNKAKDMLILSNIWYTIYSLNFIKIEYSNIVKNIIVAKVWDRIPEDGDSYSHSYIKDNYLYNYPHIYYGKPINFKRKKKIVLGGFITFFYSWDADNKREGILKDKLFYYDNIFKVYYRKLISFYIIEYYKHYVLYLWRNYWMHTLRMWIINKVRGINKSHMMLLNFIIVKTLLGLLEYNYRSLVRLKPKYYYLNKLRYYQTKFKRINLNSWANSVKYLKKLRKTPNNFWKRYHRLASFFYGRIIQNAELDTKRKIFVPFVLYFEDILYNIYGKWAIIRLWPLKRYYLSSYILARRLMALISWRKKRRRTVTRFKRKTRLYLSIIKYFEITRGYYDYYINSISQWPNSLVDIINEKRKEHYLSFKNLEYMIKRKERFYTFNTHLLKRNKLSYNHFSLWYKNVVGDKLYKKFTKRQKKLEEDLIFKSNYINLARWVKIWTKPFRQHLHGLTKGHDISSFKFTLAGRTGSRRNNARKTHKLRFFGHSRIPRFYAPEQWKYYNIGIPTIRGNMKSTYDYSKAISKSTSGAISVKVWMTSKISVDIQELLMLLVDIKHLYSQLFNKYFLVGRQFIMGMKKNKSRRLKPRFNYWKVFVAYRSSLFALEQSIKKEKKDYKKYITLGPIKKDKHKWNYYYNEIENSLKFRTRKQLKSIFALSIKNKKKNKNHYLPKMMHKLISTKYAKIRVIKKTRTSKI